MNEYNDDENNERKKNNINKPPQRIFILCLSGTRIVYAGVSFQNSLYPQQEMSS